MNESLKRVTYRADLPSAKKVKPISENFISPTLGLNWCIIKVASFMENGIYLFCISIYAYGYGSIEQLELPWWL